MYSVKVPAKTIAHMNALTVKYARAALREVNDLVASGTNLNVAVAIAARAHMAAACSVYATACAQNGAQVKPDHLRELLEDILKCQPISTKQADAVIERDASDALVN